MGIFSGGGGGGAASNLAAVLAVGNDANALKIVNLANGAGAQDAAAFGQIPSVPSFAAPTVALGSAAAAGAAGTVIRSDSTVAAFDTTVPSTQAFGDAAAVGTAAFAARRDHKHAMPTAPTVASLTDATITSPVTYDGLTYDANASKWINSPLKDALLISGALAETFPRKLTMTGAGLLQSQKLCLVSIDLPKGATITSITFCSWSQALVGGNHQYFALYNSSRALLRASNDDTSTAWAANTLKTLNLSSTFVTTYAGLHYLGILVDAGTVPTLALLSTFGTVDNVAPILAGRSTASVTSPPDPAAAITTANVFPYAYVS